MKLYLVRHGQALAVEEDPEEGLSFEGEANLYFVGKALRKLMLNFNMIFTSNKQRAIQTAEILAEKVLFDVDSITKSELIKPNSDPKAFIHFLQNHRDKESILVVSHLPFLQFLIQELVANGNMISMEIENGQVICIELDFENNLATLEWILKVPVCKSMLN